MHYPLLYSESYTRQRSCPGPNSVSPIYPPYPRPHEDFRTSTPASHHRCSGCLNNIHLHTTMPSEAERKREEAAARRHARLDNAGVLQMSAAGETTMDKITIVSLSLVGAALPLCPRLVLTPAPRPRARLLGVHVQPVGGGPHARQRAAVDDHEGVSRAMAGHLVGVVPQPDRIAQLLNRR